MVRQNGAPQTPAGFKRAPRRAVVAPSSSRFLSLLVHVFVTPAARHHVYGGFRVAIRVKGDTAPLLHLLVLESLIRPLAGSFAFTYYQKLPTVGAGSCRPITFVYSLVSTNHVRLFARVDQSRSFIRSGRPIEFVSFIRSYVCCN